MNHFLCRIILSGAFVFALQGCAPSLSQRKSDADASIQLMQEGHFEEAGKTADGVLGRDARNPYAAFVKASALYKTSTLRLFNQSRLFFLETLLSEKTDQSVFDHNVNNALDSLGKSLEYLHIASSYSDFSMPFCLSCLQVDFDQDGVISEEEEEIFGEPGPSAIQINQDDVWAVKSMMSMQLGMYHLLLAYDWMDMMRYFNPKDLMLLNLRNSREMTLARQHILEGLKYAQHIQDQGYRSDKPANQYAATWRIMAKELQGLITGEEAIDIAEYIHKDLGQKKGSYGYVNLGALFTKPGNLYVDLSLLDGDLEGKFGGYTPEATGQYFKMLFGNAYVKEAKPSSMMRSLAQLKAQGAKLPGSIGTTLKAMLKLSLMPNEKDYQQVMGKIARQNALDSSISASKAHTSEPPKPIQVKMDFVPGATFKAPKAVAYTFEKGVEYEETTVKEFEIDRTEVTVAAYSACVKAGVCEKAGSHSFGVRPEDRCNSEMPGKENHPVNCVSWEEAKKYCAWQGKRLPTHAEWVLAALGPKGKKEAWGGNGEIDAKNRGCYQPQYDPCYVLPVKDCSAAPLDNCCHNNRRTCEVGLYPNGAGPYGTLDMFGNLWEWTGDRPVDPNDDGYSLANEQALIAGGSTVDVTMSSEDLFDQMDESGHYLAVGFRCVESVGQPSSPAP